MNCYRCGASLAALSLPLLRLDECPSCSVHLHVCRMCVLFDPTVPKQCREDDADEVKVEDKERANFCDYFKPSDTAFDGSFAAGEAKARQDLTGLFGDDKGDAAGVGEDDAKNRPVSNADKLFK